MRPWLGDAERDAVAAAVASGWIAQGPRVGAFEDAFASQVGAAEGVALSSCTTALHLALVLNGIGPGDRVIVPSLSFIATANVVRQVGAEVSFADVEPGTGTLSVATIAPLITKDTRAVIVVDQAGVPADLSPIMDHCEPLGIAVIQDAACAAGSVYQGRPVGADAHMAAFSFHPRKVITTGEGGMLVLDDAETAARARRLRQHGMDISARERHHSHAPMIESYGEPGFNYRMTDMQAAMGLEQLERLPAIVSRRRELAAVYQERFADVPGLRTVVDPPWGTTNFQSFWIELPEDHPADGSWLLEQLAVHGISARRGIMAAHLEPAYETVSHAPLPVTERLTQRTVILPLFHEMSEDDQDRVIDGVVDALHRGSC